MTSQPKALSAYPLERKSKLQISDEYIDRILYYLENIRDNQFGLGDLLVELLDLHPEEQQEVMTYISGKTGMAYTTLLDYENTARRWTEPYRLQYPHMDWSFYRNSDPILDKELLDIAVENRLSVTRYLELKYPNRTDPKHYISKTLAQLIKLGRYIPVEYNDEYNDVLIRTKALSNKINAKHS